MRALFSNLVAASLVIHAMMGCCWHRAHAARSADEPIAAQASECTCGHHQDCDECADQQQNEPSHVPCGSCSHCRGVCTYLPVQKMQLDKVELELPLDFSATMPACEVPVIALSSSDRTHDSPSGPPLRLHLYHQILLI